MEENETIAPLFYHKINSFSEQYINNKILAKDQFHNNINIIKDIRNYYETKTYNCNKKLSRFNIILT